MKKPKLPKGWSEKQVRALAEHYDNQTEDSRLPKLTQPLTSKLKPCWLAVPTALVPQILALIERKGANAARERKTLAGLTERRSS